MKLLKKLTISMVKKMEVMPTKTTFRNYLFFLMNFTELWKVKKSDNVIYQGMDYKFTRIFDRLVSSIK
jgi:hypothetical protein